MAPTKRHDVVKRKQQRRKKARPVVDTEQLYKCINSLCGEECETELQPVTDGASEYSDEDYDPRGPAVYKAGRVNKARSKKTNNGIPLKVGVYKAQQYICRALDFGLQTGYLTPKDSKGKVLVLSNELMQMSDAIRSQAIAARKAAMNETRRQTSQPQNPGNRNKQQQQPRGGGGGGNGPEAPGPNSVEERDDEGDVEESHSRRRHSRSRPRHGKRRGRSSRSGRSRSRSKRRSAKRRHATTARSRSLNPETEPARTKQSSKAEEAQQDALEGEGAECTGRTDNDNDDAKSTKSNKSGKSSQRNGNNSGNGNDPGQTPTGEEKKQQQQNNSDYDTSDEDDKK